MKDKIKTNMMVAIIVLISFSGAIFLVAFPSPNENETIFAGDSFDYNGVNINGF